MIPARYSRFIRIIFLIIIICIFNFPAKAKYSGGTGEPSDPYQIAMVDDLIILGNSPEDYDKNFTMTADIDLAQLPPRIRVFGRALIAPDTDDTERNFQGTPYTGTFDGNGHIIWNLTISGKNYLGLFGRLGEVAMISNLGLEQVKIDGTDDYISGLVGMNSGSITTCYSSGTVHGDHAVGGLVGYNSDGSITDSWSTVEVSGGRSVGGLAGSNWYGNIATSYSSGVVTGTNEVGGLVGYDQGIIITCHSNSVVDGQEYVGGLVGMNWEGEIRSSYSTGMIDGYEDVGGLVGFNRGDLIHCYSTATVNGSRVVGGLVGGAVSWVTIINCYSTGSASGNSNVGGLIGSGGVVWNSYSSAKVSGGSSIGGLVGVNSDNLTRCYSIGAVHGDDYVGGLVGANGGYVSHCYSVSEVEGTGSYVGGLLGSNTAPAQRSGQTIEGRVMNCFWDIQTSGQLTSPGGIGLSTEHMQDPETYLDAGWDWVGEIENGTCQIWQIIDVSNYPVLTVFSDFALPKLQGSGSPDDPYLIHNALDLGAMIHYDMYAHYQLKASLDLASSLWSFAVIPHFGGVFDGSGHEISHLTIDGGEKLGLFGQLLLGAEIKDLGVVDVNINGSGDDIGGLVGYNNGTVSRCYCIGSISGNYAVGGLIGISGYGYPCIVTDCYSASVIDGNDGVGGLLGWNEYGDITRCYSLGTVFGNHNVGGLVGYNNGGPLTYCWSDGTVRGEDSVGGLVGYNIWWIAGSYPGPARRSLVNNCYSSAEVSGDTCVGGLMGTNSVWSADCYSTGLVTGNENVGGLIGFGQPLEMSGCFWDIDTSGQIISAGGEGKTTNEMQTASTFLGWNACDNEGVWTIYEGNDYPRLSWENRSGIPLDGQLSDFLEGTGAEDDPYLIYTAAQLALIGYFPCEWYQQHFKLMADIDLANYKGADFNIIGRFETNTMTFGGVFDGNGHTISNFNYQYEGYGSVGLFAYVDNPNAVIKNLGLLDPNVDAGRARCVGSLVGYLNQGIVTGCYVKGGNVRGDKNVGGLVGENRGVISNCYSTADVSGSINVGALVAQNGDQYTIVTREGGAKVTKPGTISYCYSTGFLFGDQNVSGIVGELIAGEIEHSFWDVETSGQLFSAGSTGKTTDEMQSASTFLEAGWDFTDETENGTEDIWWIDEGNDYPRLWWELTPEN
jgi:hypothetical protein